MKKHLLTSYALTKNLIDGNGWEILYERANSLWPYLTRPNLSNEFILALNSCGLVIFRPTES